MQCTECSAKLSKKAKSCPKCGAAVVAAPVALPSIIVNQHAKSVSGTMIGVVIYQGKEVVIPTLEAIAAHRTALRAKLETEAQQRWGGMSFYIQEEGVTLPIEASPYQTGELGARANLQDSLKSAQRMLVLGDPGSGKTIALERLAWELCAENEPLVPVLVRLFHYDGKPLAEWVRARLQECNCLRLDDENTLTVFLQESAARCVFLFDGLNEVAPEYRNLLIGELDRWTSVYPRHTVIITSRVQDELWRKLRGELPALVVQPIRAEQACDYLTAHLDAKGDELYRRLDERLLALARTPLILWLIKEAGMAGKSLPGNRGELYARFVGRMLRRDTERQMDTQFPERIKQRALAMLALHMSRAQRLTCPRDEAVDVVASTLEKDGSEKLNKAEALLTACARHGLLTGDDELWFAPHQTVQEHFAALALQETIRQEQRLSGPTRLLRNAQQTLSGQKTGLDTLAAEDWWMETLVQLAGIVEDPAWLVRTLAQTNPWLAWWCVQEGRIVDETTRAWIEQRSNQLLKSPRLADRRRAVQTLAQTRNERVLRPLLQAAADDDPEVSRLAMQGLTDMGEAAQMLVVDLLRGIHGKGDEEMWRMTLRSLSDQPESPFWSEIAGRIRADDDFLNEARRRLQGQADELPFKPSFGKDGNLESLLRKMVPINTLARIESRWVATRFWKPPYGEPEWVTIPAGEFWMGSNKYEFLKLTESEFELNPVHISFFQDHLRFSEILNSSKKPAHKISLLTYQIARVPVTNAQYALYVMDTKAKPPKHWWGHSIPPGLENHPVVNVSWYDALAYCWWLSEKIKKPVSLPSEAEWEKAARGDKDQRTFPWGNDWRKLYCNSSELGFGINNTTPVGLFMNGASPYGLLDMSGNVWEWTRSKFWDYPYKAYDGRENLPKKYYEYREYDGERRALRGGSRRFPPGFTRISLRLSSSPYNRDDDIGFRVVVCPPLVCPPQKKVQWTILIYIAAHNKLAAWGNDSLKRILSVGSTPEVKLAVLYDGYGAKRMIAAPPGEKPGEEALGRFDSGDPQALIDTARWAFEQCPAERYGLVLWGIGDGWQTICPDDGTGHSLDTLALEHVTVQIQSIIGQPLDLLGMDVALTSTLEVAYQLRQHVRYLVASEEAGPAKSWPYETILSALRDAPEMPARDLATLVVRQYVDYYAANPPRAGDVTKVALDLAHINDIARAVDGLAGALLGDMQNQAAILWEAQRTTRLREIQTPSGQRRDSKFKFHLWDLGSLAFSLTMLSQNADVRTAAQAVSVALKIGNAVVAEGHQGGWFDGIGGVSIYAVPPKAQRISPHYAKIALAQETRWSKMLAAYHEAVE